jgi:hypothetical protein
LVSFEVLYIFFYAFENVIQTAQGRGGMGGWTHGMNKRVKTLL